MSTPAVEKISKKRVLLLEDNIEDAALVVRKLAGTGFQVVSEHVQNATEFMAKVRENEYDLILCDFSLPGWNGLEALRWVRATGRNTPFIYVSGTLGEDVAVECIKEGATDYVLKNNLARLPHAVRRAVEEEELRRQKRASEEQYRLLFDNNPLPMWVFDRRTLAFLAVNEAAIRKYGYKREEFLRMSILDIRPGVDIVPVLRSLARTRQHGLQDVEIWRHRLKSGEIIDVEITSHDLPFQGRDAELVLANEITETLRSQERLRQSEERFSKAFRSSPVAITISTKDEGRYIDVNDAFLRMIGRRKDEVVGHTSFELRIWDNAEDRARMIRELEASGRVASLETIFQSKSSGPRIVDLSAELIQLDGIDHVLAITDDITEARSLEEQFRQAQKMEAVGRLAGGMAHDFNNMLGVIMGYCDLADTRTEQERIRRDVAQIKKAAERAASLTRQLLVFSRQQVLRPSILNLNNIVKGSLQMLSRVISADVELTFEPAEELWNVKIDWGQVEQILINLVVNARDAMPNGGRIVLETANVELDETYVKRQPRIRPGPYVVLSVSDTGCGIDATTMSKIFEPFFTTKPPGQGTGLGLSMVYGAMHQFDGHISVYSQLGKGTTFRLYFPRAEGQDEEPPTPVRTEAASLKGSETILLVEDEQDLRELTKELLACEGYRVLDAPDAQTALALLERSPQPIHLLLTDLVLPGMSGTELAQRIQISHPLVKVAYMSGYTGHLIAQQRTLDPSAVLIEKPFTKKTLLRQLRAVLESQTDSSGDWTGAGI